MLDTVCRTAIDWSATGDMLSGLGTVGGAIAVLIAAGVGKSTFEAWKRQKIEERRTELAETSLILAYKIQDAMSVIRSPVTMGNESDAAEQTLREQGMLNDNTGQERLHFLKIAQVIISRIIAKAPLYDELAELRPRVRTIFNEETEAHLATLWTETSKVRAAALSYAYSGRDHYRTEAQADQAMERSRRLEAKFWEDSEIGDDGELVEDAIKKVVADAVAALAATFRPHFDIENKKVKAGKGPNWFTRAFSEKPVV